MKKKYNEEMGVYTYSHHSRDLQATDSRLTKLGHVIAENSAEIVMLALLGGLVCGVGMLLHTTTVAADSLIEYAEYSDALADDHWQHQQVLNALEEKRALEKIEAHAEQPPYWTATEETY